MYFAAALLLAALGCGSSGEPGEPAEAVIVAAASNLDRAVPKLVEGFADGRNGECLGDGDEPDGGGRAPGSRRRRADAAADVVEPGGDAVDRGTCCYFLTMA